MLRNYSGSKSDELESGSITLNQSPASISFTVTYEKALAAIGMVDPGTWTLYATKEINGVPNLVELASGNLQIKMY